jgi:hypothetical protein
LIKEARENKKDLAVIWLNLANSYESVPCKFVQQTLQKYYLLEKVCRMLQDYFNEFRMRFSIGNETTNWQRLEIDIASGCTLSVIISATAVNLLVKYALATTRGPQIAAGLKPGIKATANLCPYG